MTSLALRLGASRFSMIRRAPSQTTKRSSEAKVEGFGTVCSTSDDPARAYAPVGEREDAKTVVGGGERGGGSPGCSAEAG